MDVHLAFVTWFMIVCICNALNEETLAAAAKGAVSAGASSCANGPTVAQVFKQCGERPQCGKCLSHIAEIIEDACSDYPAIKVAAE